MSVLVLFQSGHLWVAPELDEFSKGSLICDMYLHVKEIWGCVRNALW